MKNPYGKTRPNSLPYAVYVQDLRGVGEWRTSILKLNQSPEKAAQNPYASAFCVVVTPYTGPSGDMGDTYLKDIPGHFVPGEGRTDVLAEVRACRDNDKLGKTTAGRQPRDITAMDADPEAEGVCAACNPEDRDLAAFQVAAWPLG